MKSNEPLAPPVMRSYRLTEATVAEIEVIRLSMGLSSQSETLRAVIRQAAEKIAKKNPK
jgi:hypothetical protein